MKRFAEHVAEVDGLPEKKVARAEPSHADARGLVWSAIGGAMNAAHLFIGDKLGLYEKLRDMCSAQGSSVTATQLANACSLDVRWIREWCAQQAAMGVLILLDGEGDDDESLRYRFPEAFADVLANPDSSQYDVSMIQMVPAVLNRARTTLPVCFVTGVGIPYNDPDISSAIDRHHKIKIRDEFLPKVLPAATGGRIVADLQKGIRVADLGCGGGNLMLAMAEKFPQSSFHGFEVSGEAIAIAEKAIAKSQLKNVFVHDARSHPLGNSSKKFELITTYDVLHDAPDPVNLMRQVRAALAPQGTWLLCDIACLDGVRNNVRNNPKAATYYGFSTTLCMCCALSEKGGLGLGTLGFSEPVARRMLAGEGFSNVRVLSEEAGDRWFEVSV